METSRGVHRSGNASAFFQAGFPELDSGVPGPPDLLPMSLATRRSFKEAHNPRRPRLENLAPTQPEYKYKTEDRRLILSCDGCAAAR